MKRIVVLVLLPLIISCGKKINNEFIVEGEISNSDAKMIYLEENVSGKPPLIIDSSVLEGNKFKLTGSGKEQSIYSLRSDRSPYPFALVINDVKKINVKADPSNTMDPYSVSGSPASQGIIDFDKNISQRAQDIYLQTKDIDSLIRMGTPDSLVKAPYARYDQQVQELKDYANGFIDKSSSPVLALYAVGSFQRLSQQLGIKGFNENEVLAIVDRLANKFNEHTSLAELREGLKPKTAPDFSLPDTSGNPVALSSMRGKYVLVDFWASWCAPCRKENPNIVSAYKKFSDKNFTILGVSLDKTKDAWLNAIRSDSLTWTHVSDLKFWNSAAAELYKVNSIPYNVLLDPQGNIIAENLHGDALHRKLNGIFQ